MPSIDQLRSLFPNLKDASDTTVAKLYAQDYGLPYEQAVSELGVKGQSSGLMGDLWRSGKQFVHDIQGEILPGAADFVTGTALHGERPFSKGAKRLGEFTGYQPGRWAEELEQEKSPSYQASKSEIDAAWGQIGAAGFTDQVQELLSNPEIAKSYATNPLYTLNAAVRSLGPSLGAAAVARQLVKRTGIGAATAGGISEGGLMTGAQLGGYDPYAENQERAAMLAAGTGVMGGLIGAGGARLARGAGAVDIETSMISPAYGARDLLAEAAKRPMSYGGRVGTGATMETGEELFQSLGESASTNVMEGKNWDQGIVRAGVEGAMTGGLMGGAFNLRGRSRGDWENQVARANEILADDTLPAQERQAAADFLKMVPERDMPFAKVDNFTPANLLAMQGAVDRQYSDDEFSQYLTQDEVAAGRAAADAAVAPPPKGLQPVEYPPVDKAGAKEMADRLIPPDQPVTVAKLNDLRMSLEESKASGNPEWIPIIPQLEAAIGILASRSLPKAAKVPKAAAPAVQKAAPIPVVDTPEVAQAKGVLSEAGVKPLVQNVQLVAKLQAEVAGGTKTEEQLTQALNELAQGKKASKIEAGLAKMVSAAPAATVVVPKPTDATPEALDAYRQQVTPVLLKDMTPDEVKALNTVAALGNEGEDSGASLRAAGQQLGVSHQTVANRVASALQKLTVAAQQQGFESVETAKNLLGLQSLYDVSEVEAVSEAEAAQAGLSYNRPGAKVVRETDDGVTAEAIDGALADGEVSGVDNELGHLNRKTSDELTSGDVTDSDAKLVQAALRDQRLDGLDATDVDVADSRADYNDGLIEGDGTFDQLEPADQVEWVVVFAQRTDNRITAKEYNRAYEAIRSKYADQTTKTALPAVQKEAPKRAVPTQGVKNADGKNIHARDEKAPAAKGAQDAQDAKAEPAKTKVVKVAKAEVAPAKTIKARVATAVAIVERVMKGTETEQDGKDLPALLEAKKVLEGVVAEFPGTLDKANTVQKVMAALDKSRPKTKAQPAAAQPKQVEHGNVIEGSFEVITDEDVATATNLLPSMEDAVESILTNAEQQEVADYYGSENGLNKPAKRALLNDYAKWLHSGAKAYHALQDIFTKMLKAAVNGVLAVAIAFNFNVATAPQAEAKSVPLNKVTIKMVMEHPKADFSGVEAPMMVRTVADWQARSAHGHPFIVAHKAGGMLYAFDKSGKLVGKAPALYAKGLGDVVSEESAKKTSAEMTDKDKVTPAGAFSGTMQKDKEYGSRIKFVDQGKSVIAIHKVYLGDPKEGRLNRMATPEASDNRISYGCINVPTQFYEQVLAPNFSGNSRVVVTPESDDANFFPMMSKATTEITVEVPAVTAEAKAVSYGTKNGRPERTKAPTARAARRSEKAGTFDRVNGFVGEKSSATLDASEINLDTGWSTDSYRLESPDGKEIGFVILTFDQNNQLKVFEDIELNKEERGKGAAFELIGALTLTYNEFWVHNIQDKALATWQRYGIGETNVDHEGSRNATLTRSGFEKSANLAEEARSPAPARSPSQNGGTQFSEGQVGSKQKPTTAKTLHRVIDALFLTPARKNSVVRIYATQAEALQALGDAAFSGTTSRKKGFTLSEKQAKERGHPPIGLIAENIPEGQELSILLHELGVHLGMEKLIGAANMKWLSDRIEVWRNRNDNSLETKVAKWAYAQAVQSESGEEHTQEELIAYMVEGLVRSGVTPQSLDETEAHQWFRKLWAAAKSALRKLGFKNPDFSGQNLVDLAYGSAQLELDGAWHGTAADFRNFNHDYMGSGEGAQAYGWGTYLAQRVGIAKDYWKEDVKRKLNNAKYPMVGPLKAAAKQEGYLGYDSFSQMFQDLVDTEYAHGIDATLTNYDISGEFEQELRKYFQWKRAGISGKGEGSLMRVASNARDEEYLDWDKPLSEQSDVVQSALEGTKLEWMLKSSGDARTGEEAYRHAVELFSSDKAASEYLDSIGIKGIKFLDQPSRNIKDVTRLEKILADRKAELATIEHRAPTNQMWYQEVADLKKEIKFRESELADAKKQGGRTNNLVIFNDKNLVRAATQVGASRDKIKFSQVPAAPAAYPSFTNEQVQDTLMSLTATAKDLGNKALQGLVFMHDLVGIAVKEGLASAKGFNDLHGQKDSIRNKIESDVTKILDGAADLSNNERRVAGDYLRDATVHEKWGYVPSWKKDVTVDAAYAQRWNQMTTAARKVVDEVFRHGETMYDRVRALAEAEVTREYDKRAARAETPESKAKVEKDRKTAMARAKRQLPKLQGPYAPLKRFGNHVVIAKSAEYRAAEANKDEKALEKLEKDPKHHIVEFYATAGAAAVRRSKLTPTFGEEGVIATQRIKSYAQMDELPWAGIAKVQRAIEGDDDLTGKGKLMDLVSDLYLEMLAEGSARKAELKRKGTSGSADMFRAFAAQGRSQAHFVASLEKSGEIAKTLQAMKTEVKTGTSEEQFKKSRVYDEIAARYAQSLDYRETPLTDKILRTSSVWMLLTSPAYYLTNALQPFMVTMPVLGGRYGAKASTEMFKAYQDVAKMVGGMGHELDLDSPKLRLTAGERQMLKTLRDNGKIDITMASDLGKWAEGTAEQGRVTKTLRKLDNAVAKVEMLNRMVTALTAYRLSGSTDYAGEMVDTTQFNYGGSSAPRFFAANAGTKLVFQFRKYQLGVLSLIGKQLYNSFKGASPEERAIARRAFLWMFAQHAVMTGIKGAPIPAVILMLAAALGGDEDKDWERNLRKAIGDDETATLLTRGIPAWLGLDVSGRIGMGNAFSILPYSDVELSKKGYKEAVFGLSGAAIGGMGGALFDGADKMAKGQYYKGVEAMAPRGLREAMGGYRMATEGVTTGRGDVTLRPDEITFFDGLMKGVGLPTTAVTRFQDTRGDLFELSENFKAKDQRVKDDYARAFKDKDNAEMIELRDRWKELQESKKRWVAEMANRGFKDPKLVEKLKPQPLSTLLKSPSLQAKREKPWAGVEAR